MLLAILGRGIQRSSTESTEWALTPDLEVCDEKGAHLAIRVLENDLDPNSIIGGGEINVLAGALLVKRLHPTLVTCAYGARSKYLNSIGAPSESQVMSNALIQTAAHLGISLPEVSIFDETEWSLDESGTMQELHNIFTIAARRKISEVAVVTVAVHITRTSLMAHTHIKNDPLFKNMVPSFFVSELVLLDEDSSSYGERAHKIFSSRSYERNLRRELRGINDLLAGKYKSVASVIK